MQGDLYSDITAYKTSLHSTGFVSAQISGRSVTPTGNYKFPSLKKKNLAWIKAIPTAAFQFPYNTHVSRIQTIPRYTFTCPSFHRCWTDLQRFVGRTIALGVLNQSIFVDWWCTKTLLMRRVRINGMNQAIQVSLHKPDGLVAKNPSGLSRIRIKEGYFSRISRIGRPKIVRVIEGPTYRCPTNRLIVVRLMEGHL